MFIVIVLLVSASAIVLAMTIQNTLTCVIAGAGLFWALGELLYALMVCNGSLPVSYLKIRQSMNACPEKWRYNREWGSICYNSGTIKEEVRIRSVVGYLCYLIEQRLSNSGNRKERINVLQQAWKKDSGKGNE